MKIKWYEVLVIALTAITAIVFFLNWFFTMHGDEITVTIERGGAYEIELPSKGIEHNETGNSTLGKVDLNTASLDELDALPGIGPVTAQAIIDFRLQHGGFRRVDELLEVKGVGEALYALVKSRVTV